MKINKLGGGLKWSIFATLLATALVGGFFVHNAKATVSTCSDITLGVTQITAIQTYATADNTFADGWKWVFNVTVPTCQTLLQMRFGDWVGTAGTIPAATNIQFYSNQSTNAADEAHAIIISAANTYSGLMILSGADLDGSTPGTQIQITVEARVPIDSAGGSYSTSYGIQSNPAPTVLFVLPIGNINVANGTALDAVGLPANATVGLSNGNTQLMAVVWDGGTPTYDGTTAGTYAFTGALTLPAGVTNPDGKTANVNVIVEPIPTHTITSSVVGASVFGPKHGTISPLGATTVNDGDSQTYTITPDTGYQILELKVDGVSTTPADSYTFTNVTTDHTIAVSFAPITYTLTYSAGAHGSIVGTSPQAVNYGADGTAVTATPAEGYHFVGWSDQSTTNPRTDNDVTGNIDVTASFAVNQYTITFGSNGGSAVASITQDYGSPVTPPDDPTRAGYTFAGWVPTVPATMPLGGASLVAQWTAVVAPITHTQKDLTTWVPIQGGITADVTISTVNNKFHADGVPTGYTLVYYPNVGTYDTYTGEVYPVEGTNMDLPMSDDLNRGKEDYCNNGFNPHAIHCDGAKLWLVPTEDISTTINSDGSQTLVGDWNTIAPNILFETNLITYQATPITHTQKDLNTWAPLPNGITADVTYDLTGDTFQATGVPPGYTLVYYPKPATWTGLVYSVIGNSMTLPMPGDLNGSPSSDYCTVRNSEGNLENPHEIICQGAALWLVPTGELTDNHDGTYTINWGTASDILFETDLINYTAPTSTPSANLILTAPDATTINQSALVPETSNGIPTGGNSTVDTAINGLSPIAVRLQNTGDAASANVRISPIGDASGHIQLWAKDTLGNWYDINVTGWGPAEGFPVPAPYDATTNVYAISDEVGSYDMIANLILVSNSSLVAHTKGIITVAPAPTLLFDTGITDGSTILPGTLATQFTITTTGVPGTMHTLGLTGTTATPALADGNYDFKLVATSDVQAALTSYFGAKAGWTSDMQMQTQINSEIAGSSPFFKLNAASGAYSLVDNFKQTLGLPDTSLTIDDDYPTGTYVYTGTLTGTNSATLPVTVTLVVEGPTPPPTPSVTQLKIITNPQTILVDTASGVIRVESEDALGNPLKVSVATEVDFTSSPGTGLFSSANYESKTCNDDWLSTQSLTIEKGTAHISFCYKDNVAGTPTLTASSDDLTPGTQVITITSTDTSSTDTSDTTQQ
ncbi:MAG: InlB B-repeat-containing protein [Minisyncoccia bacterium]